MLDSTTPTSAAFAPPLEIVWRGANIPLPAQRLMWIQQTVQAQQLSTSAATAIPPSIVNAGDLHARQGALAALTNAVDISLRVQALRIEAEIDEVPFSNASHAELRDFIRQVPWRMRPAIFLRDNGNLRALWKNDNQEQIGLQFLGGGYIQYVIMKRRPDRKLTSHSGVASRGELLAVIKAVGATALFG
jgi:hypothetical protein